ncbi:hypothetical protein DQ04_13841000 [Trypanosoma grayi]|uniref:hypothetical protein n=1 Tax=Trypanosoma grayi TaxID=71804 RepID=UPI0004F4AE49|nr:hypothetical protein DQ04_13841000 [Trypanosoma grayi]KEG06454.1 hypothetical protein DQ04_13841000 [Trypanosoma grayi]
MALETIGGTCVFSSREEQMPGRVTRATSVPPAFQVNSSGRSTVPREAGLVALVVDGNVVVVCTVHESPQLHVKATTPPPPPTTTATATEETETVGGEEPPLKSAKVEATEIVKQRRGLTLRPGHQTYCSEDIPIRDLALFDNFLPYTLAVLLESGAVVALDPATMELLYHRPLQRLFPPRGANTKQPPSDKRDAEAEKSVDTTRSGSYFFRPRERPLALCVMEHNTAVVLRPS